MGLQGALAKLQKNGADLYVQMSQFFGENAVVRAGWIEMARDLEQQSDSLKSLPASFWNHLKGDDATLTAAVDLCSTEITRNYQDHSLSHCFSKALDFEEPIILRTYVPLIRVLRNESTYRGLEFYIQVKAHVARLTRLIEPFSADTGIVQRAHALLERFEREVQQPAIPAPALHAKVPAKRHKRVHRAPAETAKPIHARASRPKEAARPKLVKKIALPRRHAQR